ncbi:MAG: type II toxin-antitoxin system RelE/ParE family toxin [Bacteroidetes bacterium]|jgi:toxin ParE1/3/4|nr:type II toxin-antitoxin system RelE/ParE family toxin [Bacteroidota bacterium]
MVEISWTEQSIEDINNIAEYIAKDSVKYANIQVELFFERTHILKTMPLSGKITPELNKPKIRELNSGNYRIIYKIVSKNQIDILTVHNGYKLLKKTKLK